MESSKQLYPPEFIDNSVEMLLAKNTVKSQVIYITIVLLMIIILTILPLIKVNITVQGNGIVRPMAEKTEIKPLTSGIVSNVLKKEGDIISKGDTILKLRTTEIEGNIKVVEFQKDRLIKYLHDLSILLINKKPVFQSSVYLQEFSEYKIKQEQIQSKIDKTTKEVERNKYLLNNKVISKKEFDDILYQNILAADELKTFCESQLSRWQSEQIQYTLELKEINSQIIQLSEQKEWFYITSPINGTVEQFSGVYTGSAIQVGQTIAIVSPDANIIAEVYVTPRDIGYLSVQNPANIQVDAFNYTEWGMIKGQITEISNDFISTNNTPMFRVRCNLGEESVPYLELKNGFKGYIKKGMTVRARFIVTKRSLFQLLFDNVNDWLNPALNDTE